MSETQSKTQKLVDKYAPKDFSEIFGQDDIVRSVQSILARKSQTNYLFIGSHGTGKTSMAKVIAMKMFGDDWATKFYHYNSSMERGIDVVRGELKSKSGFAGPRIILLDEVDNMTSDAQQALRGLMEVPNQCTWILTGNYDYKIIPPIRGRCTIYRFNQLSDYAIMKRLLEICKLEQVKLDKNAAIALKQLLEVSEGSLRLSINNLDAVITENKELSIEQIQLLMQDVQQLKIVLNTAVQGDAKQAIKLLQKEYILSKFSPTTLINQINKYIDQVELLDDEQKLRLYDLLADLEYRLKIGCDPLLQMEKYIVRVWSIRHLPKV